MKKEKRFVVKESQSCAGGTIYIIVDIQTGVNYISVGPLGASGLTPLLDRDGKVIIDN